jgi:hypothetical protein
MKTRTPTNQKQQTHIKIQQKKKKKINADKEDCKK